MATWGGQPRQLADFADGQAEVHQQARRQRVIALQPQQLQLIFERLESLDRNMQQVQRTQQDTTDRLIELQQTLSRADTVSQQRIQNSKALDSTALLWPRNQDGVELQHAPASISDIQGAGPRILERVLRHYNLPTTGNEKKMRQSIKMHIGVNFQ